MIFLQQKNNTISKTQKENKKYALILYQVE